MKKTLLCMALVLMQLSASAQQLWKSIQDPARITAEKLERDSHPAAFKVFALDMNQLKAQLAQAPLRSASAQSNVVVSFPSPSGDLQRYRIYEAPVVDQELTNRFPDMRSYVGKGLDDKHATIRFSVTLFGLHAMNLSANGNTWYIDPYTKDQQHYMVYNRKGMTTTNTFACTTLDPVGADVTEDLSADQIFFRANNSLFKTYRMAMACTIEYAAFHVNAAGLNAGTIDQKKAAVLQAMVVTMTRVNSIYEIDFAITMVLVPNNLDIIFITSDNFDNSNTNNILLDQSQTVIDQIIGSANYDIGHTVSTGGGGVAQLQSPCGNSKARGITGLDAPVGDPYDVDYVCHEVGHQWGCHHTFNGDQGGCNGNRTVASAFEPGSGSTIMGYTGLCNSQNIQDFSDAYFHARSLIQGSTFINGNGNCGVVVPNNNTPPTVSAGANYTIPFGTAFVLRGSASDADGDALTYTWEQYNNNVSTQPPVASSAGGPNFRSLPPSDSPDRYFPNFASVLAGNLTPTWEVVPNVARTMEFSLVVRDNRTPMGGQTERATMSLTFANVGPFKVTSQATLTGWAQNSTQTVTWDVAGTTANGINTANVNIRMSADGGATFPYLLAENVPNDGSQEVTAPNVVSQNCRIMVEAVGNVFYAINSGNLQLGYQVATVCNTYEFNTPTAMPANSTSYTVKSVSVPMTGTISDVNIHVNATHPNLANLQMAVIRPTGALFTYYNGQCSGANADVTFDSEASAFSCNNTLSGTMALPAGSLSTLYGFNPMGNWQFGFKNTTATATPGTINSFWVEICSQTTVPLANKAFAFEDFALFPNPSNGSFTVSFRADAAQAVDIQVHDLRGRSVFAQTYAPSSLFETQIGLDRAEAGIYLVTVQNGTNKTVRKIVIE